MPGGHGQLLVALRGCLLILPDNSEHIWLPGLPGMIVEMLWLLRRYTNVGIKFSHNISGINQSIKMAGGLESNQKASEIPCVLTGVSSTPPKERSISWPDTAMSCPRRGPAFPPPPLPHCSSLNHRQKAGPANWQPRQLVQGDWLPLCGAPWASAAGLVQEQRSRMPASASQGHTEKMQLLATSASRSLGLSSGLTAQVCSVGAKGENARNLGTHRRVTECQLPSGLATDTQM